MPSLLRMLPQCPPRIQHQPGVHHSPRRCCQRPTWKSLDTMAWPKSRKFERATLIHAVLVAGKVRHHRERTCHYCAVPGRPGKFHIRMQPCRAHFALQKSPLPNLHPPMSQQIRPRSTHFKLDEATKFKSTGMRRRCRQNPMQLSPSGCFGRCKSTICAANLKNTLSDPATARCSGNSTTTWRSGKHIDHPLPC